ncbi:topoisomerase II-associated protein PAT1-domain-containing protein [Globomyces pollinis-pini]|nr:topoisomerase II-associated protein PAT1-domain-containing protein [Globomyces pollinis-pini]
MNAEQPSGLRQSNNFSTMNQMMPNAHNQHQNFMNMERERARIQQLSFNTHMNQQIPVHQQRQAPNQPMSLEQVEAAMRAQHHMQANIQPKPQMTYQQPGIHSSAPQTRMAYPNDVSNGRHASPLNSNGHPQQLGHPQQPLQDIPPIIIDGVIKPPLNLEIPEKAAVFEYMQKIRPLSEFIPTLMNTLYRIRGDREADNLRQLNLIRNTVLAQFELLNRGIFILRPETVIQIYTALMQFFQYGEAMELSLQQAAHIPSQTKDNVKSENSVENIVTDDKEELEDVVNQTSSTTDSGRKKTHSPKQSKPSTEVTEEENDVVEVRFDEFDFPELGQVKQELSEKPDVHRTSRQGNQKQRRQEQQENRHAEPKRGKQTWVRLDEGQIQELDDLNLPRHERYRGMMRKFEKELIAKIQIAQLVTEKPLVDDYYFQAFTKPESAPKPKGTLHKSQMAGQLIAGKGQGAIISNQMQQQMKRLIENRKASKTRETNLALDGALGKIEKNTTRNPKRAIQITTPAKSQTFSGVLSTIKILKHIEKIYDRVLAVDTLSRRKIEPNEVEELEEHEASISEAKSDLYWAMVTTESIPLEVPHPLIASMNIQKGLIAISRALSKLNQKQTLGIFSTLLTRLECLNVCNSGLGKDTEKVEAFMSHILPSLVHVIADSTLTVVSSLMKIILDRHNLIWLAKSRVGLVILTVMLSRAETLQQAVVSPILDPPSEQELSMWSEIYNFLFISYQGQFPSLFDPKTKPDDEVYVWQFLSAMAVGASGIEHQRILVSELRFNFIKANI